MIFLTGEDPSKTLMATVREMGWGRMFIERRPSPEAGEPWGFDNGAFAAWRSGGRWDADLYRRRLDAAYDAGTPLLAVVPDLVADPCSLDYSVAWMPRLPREWPWFLAVQDSMEPARVEEALPMFAGLLLGGTDRFKATAPLWAALAHANGRQFHYARCGTPAKLRHAREVGADSADSAFVIRSGARLRQWAHLWRHGDAQEALF